MSTPILIAIVAGLGGALFVRWRNKTQVAAFLQGREPLSRDAFASLFATPDEGRVAVSIRELLESWVAFDVARIRPDDEFCGRLLLDAVDGLDAEEFLRAVEKRWGISIPNEVAADLRTVRQLSSEVARRLSGSNG